MSGFSRINLLEIEDGTPGEMAGISGRFARRFLDSRDLGVSLFSYAPDYRATGGHFHREQEEAYVVVGGSGQILVDDEAIELSRWDVVRVAPETVRAFAAGPDGLEVIAVGGPKPEGGDGASAEVSWPDAGPR